ncbi:16S rRNA (uracil(1498)-N(3))-methyltransferase [Pseudanabaena sp. FACHB-2040]|uniref:16S rRNA (uracil(1498)-N(3))-methyltransferase n=1 Tax=Pseudanabaena sp. FACHB-2040 TaxID=2692859 RepID=UPI00168557D5|nr:16S rRNA (uracil(1498)-N(3))-methyltransferase [Pseudanabaena sp. FACHB-2040]
MPPQRVLISPEQRQSQQIALNAAQQRYLHRVLRLGQGDQFIALDGQGGQWLAKLTPDPATAAVVEALQPDETAATPTITLLAALPKGNGFDDVVRQVTELGVNRIQPILSDRTLIRPSDRKLERWQRIAAEATEQSERLTTPEILAPVSWQAGLKDLPTGAHYLCVTRLEAPHLLSCLQQDWPLGVTVAIGPEGGWTDAEVELALAADFQPVSLGSTILRAITAPVVALSLIKGVFEANLQADRPAP